jgi:ABC-type transport system involved in cytochrome c biogenesis permease subunit
MLDNVPQHITAILVVMCATYLAGWLALMRRWRRTGFILFGAGWVANAGLFVFNWVAAGEPPFGNMYHVQIVLALCFLPLSLMTARRPGFMWTASYFAFASALPLIGAIFMEKNVGWRRMAVLQSPWFVPHVLSYMIGYALCTVAFVFAMTRWIRAKILHQSNLPDYRLATTDVLRLSFPFMTFGMLSGALWAEQAWGAYWSWDAKETWSLITWMLYALYFHCLNRKSLQPCAEAVQLLGFLALLTTFFLVNLWPKLSSVLHSYT